MKFSLILLTFDVCDTNTYGWVTHTRMCQLFGESSQNDSILHTPKLHILGTMFLEYQLKTTTFGCPNMAMPQLCMGGMYVYV